VIDTTFDFRTDAGGGDPDKTSPTLRRYHRKLWSKPLPNGDRFDLDDTVPGVYLYHRSHAGEFWLASDAVIPTFEGRTALRSIIDQIPADDREAFQAAAYTIGGMLIFPGNQIDRMHSINQARGLARWTIDDRFDLTLECIRRHYLGQTSPLAATLARYADFFALFRDFAGYVDFFLLTDLVRDEDPLAVRFFLPFDDFKRSPLPQTLQEYEEYRGRSLEFVRARNAKIRSLDL
jgi:hypothetical protein